MEKHPDDLSKRIPRERVPSAEKGQRALLTKALSYVLPKAQAKTAALALIRKYGSLAHVLTAPAEEIRDTLGSTEEPAELLALIGQIARAGFVEQAAGIRRIFDTNSAVQAMHPLFLGRRKEAIGFMILDGRGRVLFNDVVIEGAVSEVPIYVRELVRLCIEHDASTAFLAHNHPSGSPIPSRNDLVATRQVELALRGINVTLLDHIIFADGSYFSFSDTPAWQDTQADVQEYFSQQLDWARIQEQEFLHAGKQASHSLDK